MQVIKKDSRYEDYDFNKIRAAVDKSASRISYTISSDE